MDKNLSFYTFFYLMSLFVMRGSGILAKILLARSITPYEYGMITLLVIALPGTFSLITNFCFFDVLGHADEGKKYLGFSMLFGILSTLAIAIVFLIFPTQIFTFLNLPLDSWQLFFLVLFLVLLSSTLGGSITGFLRGKKNHAIAASFSAGPSILRVIFIFLAVYLFGISDFSIVLLLFALPALLVVLPIFILKHDAISRSFRTIEIPSREMMFFGFSFFILNIWVFISQHINSIVISHDLGLEWQAYFDVSLSIVAVITFFSSAIYMISAPELSGTYNRSDIQEKRFSLGIISRLFFALCLLGILILFFYSTQLVVLVFSHDYAIAGNNLVILAIGYVILYVQQFVAYLNISTEDEGVSPLTWITMAGIIIFPVFTHFMITPFGYLGVYLSSTIFFLVYTVLTLVIVKDLNPIKILFDKIERVCVAFILTWIVMFFLHLPLFTGIITATIVFSVLTLLLGYLHLEILFRIIKKPRSDI